MKLTSHQQEVLNYLAKMKSIDGGWVATDYFDPRTVRSLIRRGLVEFSVSGDWYEMALKNNLSTGDCSIRLKK